MDEYIRLLIWMGWSMDFRADWLGAVDSAQTGRFQKDW